MWCAGLVAPWHVGSQFPNQGSNPCLLHCGPTGKSLKYWFLTTITYSFVDHHQFSSVAQSCLTLCDPTGCSMPAPEFLCALTNLDSVFKSRDVALLTKVCLVKSMAFRVAMHGCESLGWTCTHSNILNGSPTEPAEQHRGLCPVSCGSLGGRGA